MKNSGCSWMRPPCWKLRPSRISYNSWKEWPMLPLVKSEPGKRYEPFPLTDMQQAYWLGRDPNFELGGIGIHFYEELDCHELDTSRLNEAWQKTILRHDALRTVVL